MTSWGIPGYEKVTRFEVIDHRACKNCSNGLRNGNPCTHCAAAGVMGRIVVENNVSVEVMELQDDGRTLKIRLVDREASK